MRWLRVQDHAPVGLDMVARGKQQVLDIVFVDASSADGNLDARDLAREACSRAADPDAGNRGVRVRFRFLDRIADRVGRSAHVGDIAALDALALAVGGAEHDHFAVFRLAHDHGRHAEGADVDGAEDAIDARKGSCGRHYCALIPLGHGPSWHRR